MPGLRFRTLPLPIPPETVSVAPEYARPRPALYAVRRQAPLRDPEVGTFVATSGDFHMAARIPGMETPVGDTR